MYKILESLKAVIQLMDVGTVTKPVAETLPTPAFAKFMTSWLPDVNAPQNSSEALAIIQALNKLDSLIGLVLHAIEQMRCSNSGPEYLPKALSNTYEKMLLLSAPLTKTSRHVKTIQNGDICRALRPILDGCQNRLDELNSRVDNALATLIEHSSSFGPPGEGRMVWQHDNNVEQIGRALDRYTQLLEEFCAYNHTTAGSAGVETTLASILGLQTLIEAQRLRYSEKSKPEDDNPEIAHDKEPVIHVMRSSSPPIVSDESRVHQAKYLHPPMGSRSRIRHSQSKKIIAVATAIHDFEPEEDNDTPESTSKGIAFKEGDEIKIVERNPVLKDVWCRARLKGTTNVGLVPINYLEIKWYSHTSESTLGRGTEVASVMSTINTIVQTIDFNIGVLERVKSSNSNPNAIPKSFLDAGTVLPRFATVVGETKHQIEGSLDQHAREVLEPMLKDCLTLLRELGVVFENSLIKKGSSRYTLGQKAMSSLEQDNKMEEIVWKIERRIDTLDRFRVTSTGSASASMEFLEPREHTFVRTNEGALQPDAPKNVAASESRGSAAPAKEDDG